MVGPSLVFLGSVEVKNIVADSIVLVDLSLEALDAVTRQLDNMMGGASLKCCTPETPSKPGCRMLGSVTE